MARFSRRRALTSLLASAGATAAGLAHAGGPGTAVATAADEMASMAGMDHGSGAGGHTAHSGFTRGGVVDSVANGFDPS